VTGGRAGRSLAAALALLLAGAAAGQAADGTGLVVVDDGGRMIGTYALGPDRRWCLVWNHSVAGSEVADCFRIEDGIAGGRIILETSRMADLAAGLGESPGAQIVPDGTGGYLVAGIERPIPAGGLVLRRAGPAVDQRLRIGGEEHRLPPGPRGERLVIRPAITEGAGGRAGPAAGG
jgi:hypothetical protein